MATAGHYKELVDGYVLDKSIDGITCTRKYIDSDTTATDSLPDIGDSLDPVDKTLKSVVVINIRITKHGNVPGQQMYVVSYSNRPGTSTGENPDDPINSDPDLLPISGSLSAESLNIDAEKPGVKDKWVWVDTGEPVDQQIFKTIVTGSFRVVRRLDNLELDKWAEYCGTVNSGTFKIGNASFADGLVLFNGVEHEEYRNSKGERRYKVIFSFTIKKMRSLAGAPDSEGKYHYVGWNYLFDPVDGKFKEFINKETGENLYESMNLGKLLTGQEKP